MNLISIGEAEIYISDGNYSSKYPRANEFVNSGVPFIRANNLVNRTICSQDMYFITKEKHENILLKGHLKTNDVLITTRGDIGKVALVPKEYNNANINAQIVLLRVNQNKIYPKFLVWCLESQQVRKQFKQLTTGTALKQLPVSNLKKIKIPLPPLNEQIRIAQILDKADEIRQKRKQAIILTEELLKSTFLEMFGDPVINPKGWEVVKIGNITEVKTGKTPSREKPENYGGNIKWVKTTEVDGNIIYDTEEKLTEIGASQMAIFPQNSIIVAMYGQGKTRGRSAILGVPCSTNQACAVILPSNKYMTVFLWTLLQLCYKKLRELGRGGNQPNLNLSMIKDFEVTLPPIELQNKFSKFVEQTTKLKNKYRESSQESENLFNSLLQRAFKGEL